jgi:uncharacterized iron-regulated protein
MRRLEDAHLVAACVLLGLGLLVGPGCTPARMATAPDDAPGEIADEAPAGDEAQGGDALPHGHGQDPADAPHAPDPTASPYLDLDHLEVDEAVHLETGERLTPAKALDWLAAHRVVYVGERHGHPGDHALQARILGGLYARHPEDLALGVEMLPREAQAEIDAWVAGEMDEADLESLWTGHWGHAFEHYLPILRFARDNRVPIVALNASRAARDAVRTGGVEALEGELAGEAPDLDLEDPWHRAYIRAFYEAHPHASGDFEAFYRVQVLWDETMAHAAADWLEHAGPDARMLILAGGGHVRYGFGIPRRLFRRAPLPYAIVLTRDVDDGHPAEHPMRMHVDLPRLPLRPAHLVWGVGP